MACNGGDEGRVLRHVHTDGRATAPGSPRDFFAGVAMELVMASTLGQPLEVTKTYLGETGSALSPLRAAQQLARERGLGALWAGLYPWACGESLTGGVLVYTAHKAHDAARLRLADAGLTPFGQFVAAHVAGGVVGGFFQGMAVVPIVRMKTHDMTIRGGDRGGGDALRRAAALVRASGPGELWRGGGVVVARQMTNWGSRMGVSRTVEAWLCERRTRRDGGGGGCRVGKVDRACAGVFAGIFACWNHPLDVVMVRLQTATHTAGGSRPGVVDVVRSVYAEAGVLGFFRGVRARMMLSSYATLCMVTATDMVRETLRRYD